MSMTEPNTIPEFLSYIEEKYGKSASWIGERAGLSGSTVRRWKGHTKPYEASLKLIEAVVTKDFKKELPLFKKIVGGLDAPVCMVDDMPAENAKSSQMKELESIIKQRYPNDVDIVRAACDVAARLLTNHNYEFARNFAETFTCRTEEDEDPILRDALSDYNKFVEQLPDELTLQNTDFFPYSYKIVGADGYYADIIPTPHNSVAIYLWHEMSGQKMLIQDINQEKALNIFGSFVKAAEVILSDNFVYATAYYYSEYLAKPEEILDDCCEEE